MGSAVKLQLMTAGYCMHPEFITIKGGAFSPCRFPALCALIEHPTQGYIVFDTGYAERFNQETSRFPFSLYKKITPATIAPAETLLQQLQAQGIPPHSIRGVIVSHFHADHIAGLRDFPEAWILCSRQAYEGVRNLTGWQALRRGFLPGLLPDDMASRCRFIEETKRAVMPSMLAPFAQGYDILGDGSIIAISLPGHAEGHIGIYIPSHKTFLVADSCWSSAAFRELRLPHPITYLVHHKRALYHDTLQHLHQLSLQHPEVHIVPSHCATALRKWQTAHA